MPDSDQTKTKTKSKGLSLFGKGKKKKKAPATASKAATAAIAARNASNVASITAPARPTTPAPGAAPAWQSATPTASAPKASIGAHRAAPSGAQATSSGEMSDLEFMAEKWKVAQAMYGGGIGAAAAAIASPADAHADSSSESSEADYLGAKYQATLATARAMYGSAFDPPATNYTSLQALESSASHYNTAPSGASHYNTAPSGASHYNTAPSGASNYNTGGGNLYSTTGGASNYNTGGGTLYSSSNHLDLLDMSDDDSSSSDDEDELPDLGPTVDPHDPFNLGQGHLVTTPLLEKYRGEEHGTSEPGHLPTNVMGIDTPTTGYASGPEAHRATVADGKLVRPDGAAADSSASNPLWQKDKAQRLNFVMDGHGDTYLSDPKKEFLANRAAARASGETSTTRVNHSTMVAGGDVAGAGTVRARDGKIEALGDGSGHYQPAVTQTAQVARTMAAKGVMDPARSTIELGGKGGGQKDLLLSTQELLSYGEGKDDQLGAATTRYHRFGNKAALAAPEAQIRARHAAKDKVQAQLLRTVPRAEATTESAATPAPVTAFQPPPRAVAPTPEPTAAPSSSAASSGEYSSYDDGYDDSYISEEELKRRS